MSENKWLEKIEINNKNLQIKQQNITSIRKNIYIQLMKIMIKKILTL